MKLLLFKHVCVIVSVDWKDVYAWLNGMYWGAVGINGAGCKSLSPGAVVFKICAFVGVKYRAANDTAAICLFVIAAGKFAYLINNSSVASFAGYLLLSLARALKTQKI